MRIPKTDLHRVGNQPDWELVAKRERNGWQRMAAATHGILTPANAISVIGAILVAIGLWQLYDGALGSGLALVTIGRLADIFDGVVAQKTGTKSTLGEALDVTVDKLTVIAALVVCLTTGILPVLAAAIIAGRNGAIMALGLLAKAHHKTVHPFRAGKYAAALEWLAILLFVFAALFSDQGQHGAEVTLFIGAYVALAVAFLIGLMAIKSYGRLALDKQK